MTRKHQILRQQPIKPQRRTGVFRELNKPVPVKILSHTVLNNKQNLQVLRKIIIVKSAFEQQMTYSSLPGSHIKWVLLTTFSYIFNEPLFHLANILINGINIYIVEYMRNVSVLSQIYLTLKISTFTWFKFNLVME